MSRRKNYFPSIIVLIFLVGIIFPWQVLAGKIELNMTLVVDTGHPMFTVGERLKKAIEEKSGGNITVRILGLEVGGERDHLEGASSGEYQIALGGSMPLSLYASEFSAPDLPFVFPDTASAMKLYQGKLGDLMNESLIKKGHFRLVGLSPRNPRNLTGKKAIKTPADMKGLKMRVPQIMPWIKVWKEIGALPSPIAWPEVYSALQTGVIDSQENPVDVLWSSRIYEVQDHVILTKHVYSFFHWLMNESFYQKLSAADRALILDAIKESTKWGADFVQGQAGELLKKLEEKGMKVVEPDRQAFVKKAAPAIRELAKNYHPEVEKYVLSFLE